MMRLSVAALLMVAAMPANARDRNMNAVTVDGGVVCFSPYKLTEGIAAANRGDDAWTREIGCIRLREGVPAVRISSYLYTAQALQFRLMPDGGPAATMWGYAVSFKTKAGKKLRMDVE